MSKFTCHCQEFLENQERLSTDSKLEEKTLGFGKTKNVVCQKLIKKGR